MTSTTTPPRIQIPSQHKWLWNLVRKNFPQKLEEVVDWANHNYRVVTNDAEYFDSRRSPWLIDPLRCADDPLVSTITLVKPIQTGGTSLGEIMLMRWMLSGNGLIHYNWPTDDKALDRWKKFTEKRFRDCESLRPLLPTQYEQCFLNLANIVFAMQGVFTSGNLDSDTVDYVINEEVHQWKHGMLQKAKGRQTRVAFPKCINISNAGIKGDQLHQEYNEGTQQQFEVKCPGCNNFHVMRTQWDDKRPNLGGLKYDSDGCKRNDGTFDYNRLVGTMRYSFPCGYEMRDSVSERRQAACGGRYSEPFNTGALTSNRSFTYQAVACHEIRWLDLIQQKHNALRALRAGDDTDWRIYLQERESLFYDPDEHRPYQGAIELTSKITKDRAGMPNKVSRLGIGDWQQGFKALGELTHWWVLIVDVDAQCNRQVVFEGRVETDSEMLKVLDDHGVLRSAVFLDASKNTKSILSLCYREGLNAVSGIESHRGHFRHDDGSRHYYSQEKVICAELNMPPKYEQVNERKESGWELAYDPKEPVAISYNKAGLLKNFFFLKDMKANVLSDKPDSTVEDYISIIIPSDVSDEFKLHFDSWERVPFANKKTNDEIEGFRKLRRQDHLMMCLAYADMILDWSGMLGKRLAELGIKIQTEESK